MSWTNDELMAHALVGDLTPDQAAAWEKRCAADPELRAEFEALLPLVAEVRTMPAAEFVAGFLDRTMARVAAEMVAENAATAEPDSGPARRPRPAGDTESEGADVFAFDQALRKQFRWVAPAAAGAAAVLLALNIGLFQDPEQTALEAAFGLEPITIESVYSIGEELSE